MNEREQRGMVIAATCKIARKGDQWLVPSQSSKDKYAVSLDGIPRCNCPDHETRGVKCKHIFAVEFAIKREEHPDGTTARNFDVQDFVADKAYLGSSNFNLVESLGAEMFVPFKSNSTADGGGRVWNRMFAYWQFHRDTFLARYHQRSNVESAFSMIKRKYGDSVRSKTPVAHSPTARTRHPSDNVSPSLIFTTFPSRPHGSGRCVTRCT